MPWFWIVAGPNGAGKSTLVEAGLMRQLMQADLINLNADVRTRQILDADPSAANANLRAAVEIDARVAECIERGEDFLVETVLSSDKYLDDIERAVVLGYRIGLVYVALATADDAIKRVALRRSMGGHDVPKDRIVARWSRSIVMLGRVAPLTHRLYVFDNTGLTGPAMIARKIGRKIELLAPGRIPEIDGVLSQLSRGAASAEPALAEPPLGGPQ